MGMVSLTLRDVKTEGGDGDGRITEDGREWSGRKSMKRRVSF